MPITAFHTSLRDLDLLETYKAIDSVATGRIPSLFCAPGLFNKSYAIEQMDTVITVYVTLRKNFIQ